LLYPALDVVRADGDLVLAVVDDYAPTAVDEREGFLTIFFSDRVHRDNARAAIAKAWPLTVTTPREVDDEDWARRSQQNLKPVTIGRVTLFAWTQPSLRSSRSAIPIVIPPSMGFGTGHHATTRLCLAALQTIDLAGAYVVDVGTGSGVLAIAARLLGADRAVGIDNDPDAVQAARSNLAVNPGVDAVIFVEADFRSWLPAAKLAPLAPARSEGLAAPKLGPVAPEPGQADVVTANLTGAVLVREGALLAATVIPGGSLVVSGVMAAERRDVVAEFERAADLRVVWESQEDGWVGLILKSQVSSLKFQSLMSEVSSLKPQD
jgi:ribosomal protein L11 methyltransferase